MTANDTNTSPKEGRYLWPGPTTSPRRYRPSEIVYRTLVWATNADFMIHWLSGCCLA